jgi:carbon starvation protein
VEKVFSPNPGIGFLAGASDLAAQLASGTLPPERAASAPQLILGQRIDAALALLFATLLWVVIVDMLRVSFRFVQGQPVLPLAESRYIKTQLESGMATGSLHA